MSITRDIDRERQISFFKIRDSHKSRAFWNHLIGEQEHFGNLLSMYRWKQFIDGSSRNDRIAWRTGEHVNDHDRCVLSRQVIVIVEAPEN